MKSMLRSEIMLGLVEFSLLELLREFCRRFDWLNHAVRLNIKRCSWPEFQRAHAVWQQPIFHALSILAGADFAFVICEFAPCSLALEEEAALSASEEFT